jgi:tetratricopeptide (TPR) repeat protein
MTKKSDKQSVKKAESNLGAVEGALTRSEMWFERNSKKLTIVVGIVVVIVLVFFGYYRFIRMPKIEKTQNAMFMAEYYFGQSEYQKALDGDEEHSGFLDVVDTYGSVRPARLAALYAGLCYLNLGEFDNAITYLNKFKGDDEFLCAMATGAIGDAYLELGNNTKAGEYYRKAVDMRDNDVTTPVFLLKSAQCNELNNLFQAALTEYEKIQTKYPNSNEARDIEKYIARVKAKMEN